MGMQCYFHESDLPEGTAISSVSTEFPNDHVIVMSDGAIHATYLQEGDYYFDVGSASTTQMNQLAALIRNRICFTCS